MKRTTTARTLGLILLLTSACATSSQPGTPEHGTRTIGRHAVIPEGPELDVALGFHRAARSIGEEWLIVAVELTADSRGGRAIVNRSDISVFTPDGRRLFLVSQDEYLKNYPAIRVAVEQALR